MAPIIRLKSVLPTRMEHDFDGKKSEDTSRIAQIISIDGGEQRFWRVVVPSKLPHLCQRPLKNRKYHYFCYGRVHPYFQLCSPGPVSKVRLRRDNQ